MHSTHTTAKEYDTTNEPNLPKYQTNHSKSSNIQTPPTIYTIILKKLYMKAEKQTPKPFVKCFGKSI